MSAAPKAATPEKIAEMAAKAAANAEQTQAIPESEIDRLFAKATTDPTAIGTISKYVKTGRRWDITHKELIGKMLVIQRFKAIKTKYGPAMLVDIDVEGEQKSALFGASVLIDQLEELGPNVPVLAVIRKPARAYSLFDPTPEMIQEYIDAYRS